MVTALSDLVRVFAEVPLLQPDQQAALPGLQQRCADCRSLVVGLMQRGWLTNYQAERLLKGQAASLMLGPYLLLERVGEGGMGQVFKARQVSLGRIVALKVLRPELVADHETLSRFQREVQLAGQLPEHPNLIHAFDAGECGATYYLAMQYVAGIDLERLVQRSGPLAVERACECVRQAALGLQHAHEHGLVHRDIKPSNLLVSGGEGSPEVVKVLDLGLARLHGDGKHAREKAFLTTDGAVTLGTVDYQSPEQALDFHRADIRADIYSLGCTFFFLLTGKPPFGGGPLALKLMRHQQAEPPDLQELRPEVPAQVAAVVRKMLAKKPADRYQTPGEVAATLTASQVSATPARLPRRWLLAAGAGGAALLFLLLLTTYFMLRPSAVPPETRPTTIAQTKPAPPPPGSVEATVPEARDYQLVYDLNLAKLSRDLVYDEDRSAQVKRPFDRIAYFIELSRGDGPVQYLYVSLDAFTPDVKKIGVPTFTSGATFQTKVAHMNISSNVPGIVTGVGLTTGNIEFWASNYGAGNGKGIPGADSAKYDFGDHPGGPADGHGCMQVHNYAAKQTLFAINKWRAGQHAEIGIGNNPDPKGNPDWTFANTASTYRTKRLRVLVRCP